VVLPKSQRLNGKRIDHRLLQWQYRKNFRNAQAVIIILTLAKRFSITLLTLTSGSGCRTITLILMLDIEKLLSSGELNLLNQAAEVARSAGVSRATAYRYFPSRSSLVSAVIAEALMSGTPVICSNRGACPEIVSPDVGFICDTEQDYLAAVDRVDQITAAACREKAMREYHYLRMARDYAGQFEQEIEKAHSQVRSSGA